MPREERSILLIGFALPKGNTARATLMAGRHSELRVARMRHSLCKKQACCALVYNRDVQTVKTASSLVPEVPVSELGSDYRWLIHWWPWDPV